MSFFLDIRLKLIYLCFRLGLKHELSSLFQAVPLSATEVQTPLFIALSVSPILLFRTCLLKSSRFGKKHYVPVSYTVYSLTFSPYHITVSLVSGGYQT